MPSKALSTESFRTVDTNCRYQGAPEKLYFGQINGTGFVRIRAALATFVCQAWSSMVLEAVRSSSGRTCCRSSKRALQHTWKRAKPRMKASSCSWRSRPGAACAGAAGPGAPGVPQAPLLPPAPISLPVREQQLSSGGEPPWEQAPLPGPFSW